MRTSRFFVVAIVLVACAPAAPVEKPPVLPHRPPPPPAEKQPEHPARWSLRPADLWSANGRLLLGDKGTLWFGDAGERWLQAPDDPAEGAAVLLPEDLVGATKSADGKFLFVGGAGTIFVTNDPLSAPIVVRAAPEPVRAAAAGKGAIVLVTAKNAVMRSLDAGVTWSAAATPKIDGQLVGLAMSNEKGLLLGMPQRLFVTLDDAATFQPIASTGDGAEGVFVGREGEVALRGNSKEYVLDGSPPAIVLPKEAPARQPKLKTIKDRAAFVRTIVTGSRVYQFADLRESASEGADGRYSLGTAEIGVTITRKKLPMISECTSVDVGASGEVIEIVCLTKAKAPPSDAGTSEETWVTRLYRSTDAGTTFKEDGVLPDLHGDLHPTLGPDGFLFFPSRRCNAMAPIYSSKMTLGKPKPPAPCEPAHIRPLGGGDKVAAIPDPQKIHHAWLAFDRKSRKMLSVAEDLATHKASLWGMKLDGTVPEKISDLDLDLEAWDSDRGTFDVDDEGVITVAIQTPGSGGWHVRRSTDGGGTFQKSKPNIDVSSMRLAGKRALAVDGRGRTYESSDGASTFVRVPGPTYVSPIGCSTFGCIFPRGARIGWDLPLSKPPAEVKPQRKWATPIKCAAEGAWTDLGLGELPESAGLEIGASVRLLVPKRHEDGRISAVVEDGAGKRKELAMLGANPKAEQLRWQTQTFLQPNGLVAMRYTYKRKKGFGALSKVDVDIAWYAHATGKVHHAAFPQIGTWKVNHDPQAPGAIPYTYPMGGEIAYISPGGLWFRSPAFDDEQKLWFIGENGVATKQPQPDNAGALIELGGARVGKGILLHDTRGARGSFSSFWSPATSASGKEWINRTWTLWPEGGDDFARFEPILLAGGPAMHVSFPGSASMPPVDFAVAFAPTLDPGPMVPMPSQLSVKDPTPPCDAAGLAGTRLVSPFSNGTRHPVSITGVDGSLVLGTADAVLRTAGGNSCVTAWIAEPPGNPFDATIGYTAIVRPPGGGAHTLYKADRNTWPTKISSRSMACAFEPGPLPKELQGEAGF